MLNELFHIHERNMGKNKKRKQIEGLKDAYIFKDGIEVGFADTVPLYLAGFLY